ncbi:hypothetical protein [Sphingobium subterraneum]|nr:hypothetical protein [Sphingobium subterraneum]
MAALTFGLGTSPAYAKLHMYAHKAGVSKEVWDTEEKLCIQAGKDAGKNPGVSNPYNPVTQSTAAGAAGASFAAGFMNGILRRKAMYATYYGCLKAHGYVQRNLPEEQYQQYKKLKGAERDTRLYELTSADNTTDPVVPEDEYD